MSLRPIVRALVVPVLGLSLSGLYPRRDTETFTPPAPGDEPRHCPDCAREIGVAIPAIGVCKHRSAPAAKVVNVNQATSEVLMRLPGVGASLAWRIVTHRQTHGAFRRPEDLMQIKGIGEKFFAALKPYVVVSGPTTLTEKVRVRA